MLYSTLILFMAHLHAKHVLLSVNIFFLFIYSSTFEAVPYLNVPHYFYFYFWRGVREWG